VTEDPLAVAALELEVLTLIEDHEAGRRVNCIFCSSPDYRVSGSHDSDCLSERAWREATGGGVAP
jgi:uncharacterized protein (DUF2237 family)